MLMGKDLKMWLLDVGVAGPVESGTLATNMPCFPYWYREDRKGVEGSPKRENQIFETRRAIRDRTMKPC